MRAVQVTEYQRHELFTWLERNLGPERAATMMNLLPPVGWADLATKHDLAELEGRLHLRFEALEARFEGLEGRFGGLEARFEGLEARFESLGARVNGSMATIDARFDAQEGRIVRSVALMLLASQAVVLAMIALLLGPAS